MWDLYLSHHAWRTLISEAASVERHRSKKKQTKKKRSSILTGLSLLDNPHWIILYYGTNEGCGEFNKYLMAVEKAFRVLFTFHQNYRILGRNLHRLAVSILYRRQHQSDIIRIEHEKFSVSQLKFYQLKMTFQQQMHSIHWFTSPTQGHNRSYLKNSLKCGRYFCRIIH